VRQALRAAGSRVIEYWTLRAAARAAPSDAATRARMRAACEALRGRVRAARGLWEEGAFDAAAHALGTAREALDALAREHPTLTSLIPEAIPEAGRSTEPSRSARETDRALRSIERVACSIEHASRAPLGRALVLLMRLAALALALGLSVALAKDYRLTVHRPRYVVRTSGRWNSEYSSFFAADGDRRTNWLLPDGTFGWVELGFAPREIRTVKLYNVWQMYWYAAHAVAVEPTLGGRSLGVHELDISRTIGRGEPWVFTLPTPVRADAVRVHVRSYDGYGGGLGEVEIP
jgi:hypothetical protein